MRQEDYLLRTLRDALDNTHPSWRERVWVLQEVVLVGADPIFAFCSQTMGWEDMKHKLARMKLTLRSSGFAKSLGFIDELRESFRTRQGMSLHRALELTKASQASDYRDKVFGLLALLPPTLQENIQPSYEVSCAKAFRTVLFAQVLEDQDFKVLAARYPNSRKPRSISEPEIAQFSDISAPPLWAKRLCEDPSGYIAALDEYVRNSNLSVKINQLISHLQHRSLDYMDHISPQVKRR
jgi:hypothetical protein